MTEGLQALASECFPAGPVNFNQNVGKIRISRTFLGYIISHKDDEAIARALQDEFAQQDATANGDKGMAPTLQPQQQQLQQQSGDTSLEKGTANSGNPPNDASSSAPHKDDEDTTNQHDEDERLARMLQEEEENTFTGLRKDQLETWKSRIQHELLQLSTGSTAVPTRDNGHDFHYRSHKVNLESGTCYIWFSIHVPNNNKNNEVVVMMDASTQALNVRNIQHQGKQEQIFETVDLYPFQPPRIQFVSGQEALPPKSTIQSAEIMNWKWFAGGNYATTWSPADRIEKAIAVLAKSLVQDYCILSRPFPPPLLPQRGIFEKLGFFVFGCCCQHEGEDYKAKKTKAQTPLNQFYVAETEPQDSTADNNRQEKAPIGTNVPDNAKKNSNPPMPKDLHKWQNAGQSGMSQPDNNTARAEEEEKQEIEAI